MTATRRPDSPTRARADELIRAWDGRPGPLGSLLGRVTAVDQVGVENPRPLQSGFVDETDWSKIAQVMNSMHAAPMWIDDSPVLTVLELRTKARRLEAEQRGLDLLIVDYLQLMQGSLSQREPNRVQEVSEISRGLKQLARELKVPVIALSQLSRGVEQRGSAEPRLSDLRESGSIEQDADVVIFLYRDGEANQDSDVELIKAKVAKHRNGPIGEVPLQFRKTNTRFYTMAARETEAVTY